MKHDVAARIGKALGRVAKARGLLEGGPLPVPAIDRPKKPEHGDFATNVALALAKRAGCKPQELAGEIKLELERDAAFERVDVAGPGFINVKLAPAAFHEALRAILAEGKGYGRARAATGERINLEFVSANPTGPMHMGHGRGAVTGDVIGRLLEAAGHRVVREYYVNDAGNQVKLLADSVLARAQGREVPEGGYGGEYVTDLAAWSKTHYPKLVDDGESALLAKRLVAAMIAGYGKGTTGEEGIRGTLRLLGIDFDVWSSEAALHDDGRVESAINTLRANGWLRDQDSAVFFESTRLGDDKDRVVYKSDGGHTYFASDIAYHKDKLDRGFERLIDVLGADHHGYVGRMRAVIRALGLPDDRFEVLTVQMVSLLKDGQPYKMGKRLGNFITIDEVIDEIDQGAGRKGAGRDALRYFFSSRSSNSQLDIDVEIAKKQSDENPVYYLQYGHARLCSIQGLARAELGLDPDAEPEDLSPLIRRDELELIALLAEFPAVVADAAAGREPHKVVSYLNTLAQAFASHYTRGGKDEDTILPRKGERQDGSWKGRGDAYLAKVRARLALVRAIRTVYAAGLGLLGIDALERMERRAVADAAVDAAAADADS